MHLKSDLLLMHLSAKFKTMTVDAVRNGAWIMV